MTQVVAKSTGDQRFRYRRSLEAFLRAMGDAPSRATTLAGAVRHVRPAVRWPAQPPATVSTQTRR
jgi:hypothetical protein